MSLGSPFNRLWSASIVSNLADGMAMTAFPLLAISLTKDPVLISITGALVMLPWLLFAVPIGAIVDSVNRKYVMAAADAARGLIAAILTLTIIFDVITIYWLFAFVFAAGITEVFGDTSAQTVLPSIVEKEKLEVANSRMEITSTIIQNFVGAPIGGLIYAVAIAAPFIANSLGFFVASIICLSIPLKFVKSERESGKTGFPALREDMREGIHFLWAHKDLRRLVLMTSAIGIGFSFATSTQILFMVDLLHLNPKYFGVLMSAFGAFSLIGAYLAPKNAKKFGRGNVLRMAMISSTGLTFVTAFSPNLGVYIALALLGAFSIVHWNIVLMATYQRLIPQEIYGRVHGARRTLVWGSMPIASLLGGFVAKIDLRLPCIIGGAFAFALAIGHARFIKSVGDSGAAELEEIDSASER
jgi:MFS family permease